MGVSRPFWDVERIAAPVCALARNDRTGGWFRRRAANGRPYGGRRKDGDSVAHTVRRYGRDLDP